jgi:hypothetical protein
MKHFSLLALFACLAFSQSSPLPNPAANNSLMPAWSTLPDGTPVLSWIEKSKEGYSLKYSVHHGAAWSEPRTIAAGRKFFRHPAEVPEVIALSDGTLVAHWIEQPSGAGDSDAEYAYVSASHDGIKWTAPVMAHKDRSPVQHGLASMVASGDHEASLIWLEALKGEDAPVAMKRTVVSAEGEVLKEETLNPDVCGCCPTSIVKTARGLLLAYRAHTTQDIRDIAVVRFENGKWSPAKIVNPDNWKIDACPTNAASAGAKGDKAAVSWYTAAQDMPMVKVAFSNDAGATFGKPTLVSTGHAYGYTSLAIDDDGGAYVSWLEQGGTGARILFRHIAANGTAGPVMQIAQGAKASLGYPKLLRTGGETWIAWGSATGDGRVQTAHVAK